MKLLFDNISIYIKFARMYYNVGVMKKTMNPIAAFSLILMICACSASSKKENLKDLIVGKYASQHENEFDHVRDTLEIKSNDQATFDIIETRWTSAKKDDPERPVNKIAGQWNGGESETIVGEFQESDTTLRVSEQITGRLRIIAFDLKNKTLKDRSFKGTETVYQKIQQ